MFIQEIYPAKDLSAVSQRVRLGPTPCNPGPPAERGDPEPECQPQRRRQYQQRDLESGPPACLHGRLRLPSRRSRTVAGSKSAA